eukprot:5861474-Pyramimonas_sp.AAC.1
MLVGLVSPTKAMRAFGMDVSRLGMQSRQSKGSYEDEVIQLEMRLEKLQKEVDERKLHVKRLVKEWQSLGYCRNHWQLMAAVSPASALSISQRMKPQPSHQETSARAH